MPMALTLTNTHTDTLNHLEYFCFGFASLHADRILSNLNQKKKKKDIVEGKRTHIRSEAFQSRCVSVCVWANNSPKLFGSGLLVSKSKHATGISYTQANT